MLQTEIFDSKMLSKGIRQGLVLNNNFSKYDVTQAESCDSVDYLLPSYSLFLSAIQHKQFSSLLTIISGWMRQSMESDSIKFWHHGWNEK